MTTASENLSSNEIDALPLRPCVGIMLLNRNRKVWIGRRISKSHDDPNSLIWQMPQGGIDEGEDPQDAAFRELQEETGVTSARLLKVSAGWHDYELPRELWGKALKGALSRPDSKNGLRLNLKALKMKLTCGEKPTQKAEFDQWKWESSEKLPGLIIPFKRQVYSAVIEEFSDLLG